MGDSSSRHVPLYDSFIPACSPNHANTSAIIISAMVKSTELLSMHGQFGHAKRKKEMEFSFTLLVLKQLGFFQRNYGWYHSE